MGAARFAVTAQERIFVRFNENKSDGMIFLQVFQKRRQFLKLQALACIHQQGSASEVPFTGGVQLRKNRDELYGKIVHAIEAHVFESVKNGTLPGTGKACEDNELPGVVSRLRRHVRAAQLFSRRWWVLGILMSSRYFATVRRVT